MEGDKRGDIKRASVLLQVQDRRNLTAPEFSSGDQFWAPEAISLRVWPRRCHRMGSLVGEVDQIDEFRVPS